MNFWKRIWWPAYYLPLYFATALLLILPGFIAGHRYAYEMLWGAPYLLTVFTVMALIPAVVIAGLAKLFSKKKRVFFPVFHPVFFISWVIVLTLQQFSI